MGLAFSPFHSIQTFARNAPLETVPRALSNSVQTAAGMDTVLETELRPLGLPAPGLFGFGRVMAGMWIRGSISDKFRFWGNCSRQIQQRPCYF